MNSKVMIGVVTAEYARRADFYDHFNIFDKPANSVTTFAHGQSPARGRNIIIKQALENECTHVFFMDDDVILPPDALTKLLAHDVDIVSGLYLMRNYPHKPIAFDHAELDGRCSHLDLANYNDQDLIEIVSTGLGCLLVKTDVFRKMEEPWIRMGELESDMWCDDLGFYFRTRKLGFTGYLDPTIHVGHIASMIIYPVKTDKGIRPGYNTASKELIIV